MLRRTKALDQLIRANLDALPSKDKEVQGAAYQHLAKATAVPVDWAYEAWDELLASLRHKDNRLRSIASQILCNLAKSDPKKRIVRDLPALLAVTKDEKFVTARHCLQSLWKVGAAGASQRKALVDGLAIRFQECATEKNCTLIRYDILESLRKVFDAAGDEKVKQKALELIATEKDLKYRKKYATLWKA
jgi:hypothetical protein